MIMIVTMSMAIGKVRTTDHKYALSTPLARTRPATPSTIREGEEDRQFYTSCESKCL